MLPILQIQNIYQSFDRLPLLRGLSLEIARGEIACLLGPSGSGKTTLLRIVAGLEQPTSGEVIFDGQDMRDVPVHQRSFGLMFQDLALFPQRDVFGNVAFGLRMQNAPRSEIEYRVRDLLELVGLKDLAARDVNQLSGGEQQRVALARALAPQPRLLMLDEPLGALDRILREQLVSDLRTILKQLGMTALYVTHDQNEAFAVADRVYIIYAGKIAQSGTPQEVYDHPANAFIARFLGMENLLLGRIIGASGEDARVETDAGIIVAKSKVPREYGKKISEVTVLIRSDAAQEIVKNEQNTGEYWLQGVVVESRFAMDKTRVVVRLKSGVTLTLDWRLPIEPDTPVCVQLDKEKITILAG